MPASETGGCGLKKTWVITSKEGFNGKDSVRLQEMYDPITVQVLDLIA